MPALHRVLRVDTPRDTFARVCSNSRLTVVVWEEATAVRHRVLMRSSANGRTFNHERILSEAVQASALGPDVAVTPRGEFIAAWQDNDPRA